MYVLMNVIPKRGVDSLLFGMKQKNVIEIIGMPNKKYVDEDQNIILIYNNLKLILTFYEEEDFRLGYIVCANEEAILFDKKIISAYSSKLSALFPQFKNWEVEDFDTFEHHFNEGNWLVLVTEFDIIVKIEIGAIIENDEFVWAYN